jgi:hypothetical protein
MKSLCIETLLHLLLMTGRTGAVAYRELLVKLTYITRGTPAPAREPTASYVQILLLIIEIGLMPISDGSVDA